MTCKHGAQWYNCDICHRNSLYKVTTAEAEHALKQCGIIFAVIAITGYITPPPYSAFTFFAACMIMVIVGLRAPNRRKIQC